MQSTILDLGHRFRRVSRRLQQNVVGLPASFLGQFITNPSSIGAVCPSSPWLANYMASQVPPGDGLVVELGPGTGAVTRALLNHGVNPRDLLLIEFSEVFAGKLNDRFPHVSVVQGNAVNLAALLPAGAKVKAIVSSLPLCSLPAADTQAIVAQWNDICGPTGGRVIQFTYNLGTPSWQSLIDTRLGRLRTVATNLPPAQVLTFLYPTPQASSCPNVSAPLQPNHRHT